MNRVVLIGRLTNDAEIRVVNEDGRCLLTFTLAVKRNHPNAKGEFESDFIPIAWWKDEAKAKVLQGYLAKGKLISVEGRLNIRSYESKEGQKRYSTQVIADELSFLEKKSKEAAGE